MHPGDGISARVFSWRGGTANENVWAEDLPLADEGNSLDQGEELWVEYRTDSPDNVDTQDLKRVLEQTLRVASGCLPMVLPASQSAPFSYEALADTSGLIPLKGEAAAKLPTEYRSGPPPARHQKLLDVVQKMALMPVGLYGASADFALHAGDEPKRSA
ncbi:MAG: hypothetical protein HY319_07835 [Armatimonadetes bacterium]|nr:hypothetical protein [Armatimonadota bacterium]